TRLVACVTGGLCVFYVNLTFPLPVATQRDFAIGAASVIGAAVVVTIGMALWETRNLRHALGRLAQGEAVEPGRAARAGPEAVTFPGRHARTEALVDPLVTIVPLCIFLYVVDGVGPKVLIQVAIAGFLGLSVIILQTFFMTERWLAPVIGHLLCKD